MSKVTHLLSLARSLPPSPIRQAGSPQLSDAFERIITRTFPQSASSPASSSSATPSTPTSTSQATATTTMGTSEQRAMDGMINSLERIKSNAALNQYPLGSTTLRPAHDPLYYKRMMDGVHLSQKGQGRSWWRRFFQLRGEA